MYDFVISPAGRGGTLIEIVECIWLQAKKRLPLNIKRSPPNIVKTS